MTPAVVDQAIYAASADGQVLKLDLESGRQLWKVNTDLGLTAGVGANAKGFAVVGQKGVVMNYDSQGRLRWKANASSEVLAAPILSDQLVIVHSIDNRVQAFDIETGQSKWIVERPLPILTLRIVTGLTIQNGNLFLSTPGGKLVSLALQNGGVRWESTVAEPKGATELERVVDMSGAPAIVGSNVCATSYQGRVACFDLSNGSQRWNKSLSSEVGAAVDERFVFANDQDGAVYAYAISGGASVWKNDQFKNRGLATPSSYGQAVVFGDKLGYVHFLSREDGTIIGRIATDGSKIMNAPLVAGNRLITQTKAGTLVAIATE